MSKGYGIYIRVTPLGKLLMSYLEAFLGYVESVPKLVTTICGEHTGGAHHLPCQPSPSGSILFVIINPRGAQEWLAQERKPVQSGFRFTDICPKISIQGLNLHGLFLDLGGDFQMISWSWTFSADTLVSHISRLGVWKPIFTLVSRTHRLRTDFRSWFNHQALVAAHSLYAIRPPHHTRAETSVAKQPHIVTVLATSARLKH